MSKNSEERVDSALQQLLEWIVPVYPDDDESSADQRLDEAYAFAREVLGGQGRSFWPRCLWTLF